MAHIEPANADTAVLAPFTASDTRTADGLYELGIMYAAGRSVPADLVAAHKWFNIAAMKGHPDGARMRREIAAEMTDGEIGQAQRAARDWLSDHAEVPSAAPQLRVAA